MEDQALEMPPPMTDQNEDQEYAETMVIQPAIPTGRVKRIMIIDKEISRVNAEALFLISCSAELFLKSLAEKSAQVAIEKKRKIVKPDFIRTAVKRHQPTCDFLLDCLPDISQPSEVLVTDGASSSSRSVVDKTISDGFRRIEDFFGKSVGETSNAVNES